MSGPVRILTLALIAGLAVSSPAHASQNAREPHAPTPAGWTERSTAQTQYYVPNGDATAGDTYEAVFPVLGLDGSLQQTADEIWHEMIGRERLVDSKSTAITAQDGAPAYEILVATLDAKNRGVYRVFVVKQYGNAVAAGELRFTDIDRMKAIGKPALDSLLEMRP